MVDGCGRGDLEMQVLRSATDFTFGVFVRFLVYFPRCEGSGTS